MKSSSDLWKYHNTMLLVVSLVLLALFADAPVVHGIISQLGAFGYAGVFVAGIFIVSTFTVAPATLALFHFAQEMDPFLLILVGGAGGVVGDLIIFRFLKDGVYRELAPLFRKAGARKGSVLRTLFKTKHFMRAAPVLGALIIASPFPDELGIALMGFSKLRWWQFAILTFLLDMLAMVLIVLAARAFA